MYGTYLCIYLQCRAAADNRQMGWLSSTVRYSGCNDCTPPLLLSFSSALLSSALSFLSVFPLPRAQGSETNLKKKGSDCCWLLGMDSKHCSVCDCACGCAATHARGGKRNREEVTWYSLPVFSELI